jgi:teichuronic acid biosynthesis glycosyltransferase TuaC
VSLRVSESRVRVIPNGVDSGIFYPRDRFRCRAKHGIPAEAKVVLSAGALIARKGHDKVIEVVSALAADGFRILLIIAGKPGREGNYRAEIENCVSRLGLTHSVRLVGQVSIGMMAELMSAADVFCLASSREGWPNVVHEALACGLPVVATDVGAVPDLIASPDDGAVVPVNDKQALAAALRVALSKPWNREAISDRAHLRSWHQVAEEVSRELNAVCVGETGSAANTPCSEPDRGRPAEEVK